MSEELSKQVWMPVKHAARAAGVPERSAFRWARRGVVPVRRSGKVQFVEVAANANLAVIDSGSRGIPGDAAANAATLAAAAAAEDRLCLIEVLLEELERRVEALECCR